MTEVAIKNQGKSGKQASEMLIGHNLENVPSVQQGLLTNRLSNSKFLGPAHHQTGIAPDWLPSPKHSLNGIRFELTYGASLSGSESQLIHNYCNEKGYGILQTGIHFYKGETLEAVIWARVQNEPVELRIGIKPPGGNVAEYDSRKVSVNSAYWKEYSILLHVPADNEDGIFYCHLEGSGMVWLDQVILKPAEKTGSKKSPLNENLLDHMRSLDIPVLRFPGGGITTGYHWKLGTGPRHLRPTAYDPCFKKSIPYEFGTDEYLSLCTALKITPHITVNISTGTPEEAGEWAAYCEKWYRDKDIEPPFTYWQIGNEQYHFLEIGHMTAEMYADTLKEFTPVIRKQYPNSKIVALGFEEGEGPADGRHFPWRSKVLDKAPDMFDILAMHFYHTEGWNEDKKIQHYEMLKGIEGFRRNIQTAIDDCNSRGLKKGIAITEWNLWYIAEHHDGKGFYEPYDVQHGLFVAGMLDMFIRFAPNLELANFYHLLNPMGVFTSDGTKVEATLLADVFRLYRSALPGEVITITHDSPYLLEEIPAVDVVCLSTGDIMWLFLANRSSDEPAEISLKNFPDIIEGVTLEGNNLSGKFETIQTEYEKDFLTIPPLSLTRLQLKKGGNK